jgi:hypothetical protein
MRDFCSKIVRASGNSWVSIGWTLWVVTVFLPWIPLLGTVLYPAWLGARILLALWWVIDLIDQDMVTTFFGGFVALFFLYAFLTPGGVFFIFSWLVYMTSVRKNV